MDTTTLQTAIDLAEVLARHTQPATTVSPSREDIRIVILQRGWVAVGRFSQAGSACYLDDAHIIRRWGTTSGLGQIAREGPTKETVLDATPRIAFHELSVIATIQCEAAKWQKYFK